MQLKMKQEFAEVLNQEFTLRLKQCEHIYGEKPLKSVKARVLGIDIEPPPRSNEEDE